MINNRENVLLFEEKVVYLQTKKFGSAYMLLYGVRTRMYS